MLVRSIFLLCFLFLFAFRSIAQDGLFVNRISRDTTNLSWSGKVKNGQRTGEWKAKDQQKKIRVQANFEKGILNGEWSTFAYNEQLVERGNYSNGQREGVWIGFYTMTDTLFIATYSNGVVNGTYVDYLIGNKLRCKGNVVNGNREGRWEYYMYGAAAQSQDESAVANFTHDTLNGPYERYHNKRLVESLNYKNGKYEGACRWYYFTDGKIIVDETYTSGKRNGVCIQYSKKTGAVTDSGRYEMDQKVGYHFHLNSTGTVQKEWYRPVLRDSVLATDIDHSQQKNVRVPRSIQRYDSILKYGPTGILETKQVYRDTAAGVWVSGGVIELTTYDISGMPSDKISIVAGKIVGNTVYYYPNGKIKATIHQKEYSWFPANWYYENGKLRAHDDSLYYDMLSTRLVLYDRSGKVIPETASNYNLMRDSLYELTPVVRKNIPQVPLSMNNTRDSEAEPLIMETWNDNEEVLSFAEDMPRFVGGDAAFQEYLENNIVYPSDPQDSAFSGTVYIYFEVTRTGTIEKVKTQKGIPGHPAFAKEAERVIAAMPPWDPGKMNGRSVRVAQTVPVRFAK